MASPKPTERVSLRDKSIGGKASPRGISSSSHGPIDLPKRLPPIKAPVGLARGPDLKSCKSKVGSLNNIKHTPKTTGVQINSQKLQWNAKSKVGSLENKEHKPGGGKLKVETRKLEWKTSSKVQSLQNINHKPGGGNVKIFNDTYVQQATEKEIQNKLDAQVKQNEVSLENKMKLLNMN